MAITELLAEVEDEGLLGGTGLRSLEHFATWQLGVSAGRARVLTAIARRRVQFPVTVGLLDTGLLSEDQVGVIARKAPAGTDEHDAELARTATVAQLSTALRARPEPAPPTGDTDGEKEESAPACEPDRQVSAWWLDDDDWELRARLDAVDGALVDAALRAHLEALVAEWKREKDAGGTPARPFPRLRDALVRMAEHSLDAAAHLRPHGHRTTVVLHVDVDRRLGELHLGPALSEAERRYLSCDALARTPTTQPPPARYHHPTGEPVDWRWYDPPSLC